jgi:hypothetical protein
LLIHMARRFFTGALSFAGDGKDVVRTWPLAV